MQKSGVSTILLLLGVLIGGVLTLQMRSEVPSRSSYPLDEFKAQKELITLFTDEQKLLEQQLLMLQQEIAEAESKKQQLTSKTLQEELNQLLAAVGLESVIGSGARIFLADGAANDRNKDVIDESMLVHATDLKDIVNLLFANGATALAINNQRVLPLSPINFVGNSFLIDNFHIVPPFTIEAVGSASLFKLRISDERFLPDIHKRLKQRKIRLVITEKSEVTIPAYTGSLHTVHLSLYEESTED